MEGFVQKNDGIWMYVLSGINEFLIPVHIQYGIYSTDKFYQSSSWYNKRKEQRIDTTEYISYRRSTITHDEQGMDKVRGYLSFIWRYVKPSYHHMLCLLKLSQTYSV